MRALGVFVSGATGSGKTRMTTRHAEPWRRRVIVNPTGSVQLDGSELVTSYAEALKRLPDMWAAERFSLSCMFTSDVEYAQLFQALNAVVTVTARGFWQDRKPVRPTLLVIDEVDNWSSPNAIDPALDRLLRYGRHAGVSWCVNCRADVETNRSVRMNAAQLILFQQGMLSTDTRRALASAQAIREAQGLSPVPNVLTLTRHDSDQPRYAVEGRHFAAIPSPWGDWWQRWCDLARLPLIQPPTTAGA